jgi:ligand-binding SRPBCC domain-containing protein
MTIHDERVRTMRSSQLLDAPVATMVRFFHDVKNLPLLAPPFPSASLLVPTEPFREGAEFRLRLSAGPLGATWLIRIDELRSDGSFVDSFRGGPFRSWRHTHSFAAAGERTIVRDSIEVQPAWWFAPVAPLFVRGLFWYRRRALGRLFR